MDILDMKKLTFYMQYRLYIDIYIYIYIYIGIYMQVFVTFFISKNIIIHTNNQLKYVFIFSFS